MSGPDRHNFQQHRSQNSAGTNIASGLVPAADGSGGWTYASVTAPTVLPQSVPLTPFDEHDVIHGYTLTKQGQVIARGGSSSWKEALVESPSVFWSPEAGKYAMVFVGYSGALGSPTLAKIGVATSTDLTTWTEYASNPVFAGSGSGADSIGTSGPFVWYENETYHLFYIGLTASGYEAGTKSICHATSTDWIPGTNAGTWIRHGAVISVGTGWRASAVWHPNIVKRGSTYYLFFNAGGTEAIGYATSSDLSTWTVDDVNSPVISAGTGWESAHVGDPYVYRIGETWYMAYYGYDGSHAKDGLAFTSDADFPLTWKKYAGNPTITVGGAGAIDEKHAHKPAIWITPTTYYHWYTAVSNASPEVRSIALATQAVAASGSPTGSAGGDLSGAYPNPTVAQINGSALGTTTGASTGDRLRWNGSAWAASSLIWRPVTTYDPTTGLWVPLVDGSGNAIMAEA